MESDRKDHRVAFDFKQDLIVERLAFGLVESNHLKIVEAQLLCTTDSSP